MSDDIKTGTDALRAALRARNKFGGLARLSRDLGVGIAALEEFAFRGGTFTSDTKTAIAREVFGGYVTFDAATDRLKSTNAGAEAIPLGSARAPGAEAKPVDTAPLRGPVYVSGPRLPASSPPKRPGWAD